jgi:hypothetical protein
MTRYLPAPGFKDQPLVPPKGWGYAAFLSNGPYRDTATGPTAEFDKAKVQEAAKRAVSAHCSLLVLDTEHVRAWDDLKDAPNAAYIAALAEAVAAVHESAPDLKVCAVNPTDRPSGDTNQCEIQVLAPDPVWARQRGDYLRRAYLVAQAQYRAGLRVFSADTIYFSGDPNKSADIGAHMVEFIAFCQDMRRVFPGLFLPCVTTRRAAPGFDWRRPELYPFLTPWHMAALCRAAGAFADGLLLWHVDFAMPWAEAVANKTIAAALA